MKIKAKYMQMIGVSLALAAAFALCSPWQALAVSFDMTYQNYWVSRNADNPGFPPSPAGESGSLVDSISGSRYSLQAVSSAYGQIYATPFTEGRGAGAHHQEFWDVWLRLLGEDGEEADLYIDSEVWGEVDLEVVGLARAFTVDRSALVINNAAGTPLLDYYYTWSEDKSVAAVILGREFEDLMSSLYLGTMIVGDPVWGSINISGYQYGTATAQARSFAGGFALCDIVSRFKFEISALETPPTPEPVPEPSTMLLIGTGLIGLVGFRRKFRK